MVRIWGGRRAAVRTLGVLVLLTFASGFASGPLRPCRTHPAHGQSAPDASVAHRASAHHPSGLHEPQTPQTHDGCSCLGHCSLEQPPHLSGTYVPVLLEAPPAPLSLAEGVDWVPTERDRLRLHLPRPPPTIG